jgi:radical SAM protein with 4Fe4S-binding SPASM domain
MEITRAIKNWLVINPLVAKLFGLLRKTHSYQTLVVYVAKRQAAAVWKNKEFTLGIETTNICNAECVFCPYTTMERKKKVMDDETFNLLVRRLKEEGIQPYGISLNGTGEPLIDKKIFDRARLIRKEFPKTILKFHSNFNLATEKTIEEVLSSGLDEINISVNGYDKEKYEEIMKIDYDQTMKNIRLLIEKRKKSFNKLKIRISMALVARNEGDEKNFLKEWSDCVDSVAINRAHNYGGTVEETAGKNRIEHNVPPLPCKALWTSISIGSDGQVLLCCLDHEGKDNLGNIRDKKLLDIYFSDKLQKYRQMHMDGDLTALEKCAKCSVPYDHGGHWFAGKQI